MRLNAPLPVQVLGTVSLLCCYAVLSNDVMRNVYKLQIRVSCVLDQPSHCEWLVIGVSFNYRYIDKKFSYRTGSCRRSAAVTPLKVIQGYCC